MTWIDNRIPVEAIRKAGVVIQPRQGQRWACSHPPRNGKWEQHWIADEAGDSHEAMFCLDCWAVLRQAGVATRPGTWDHERAQPASPEGES